MSPHLSTRSSSGTRCIGGIKVSPSRNNQCHCVTPCYQDVMLVWRRVTRSYRRAAQCDVWHSGQVRARVTWPGYTPVICHLCRHAPAPARYCAERRVYFVGRTFSLAKISRLARWKIFPHLESRSDLILLLLGSGVHLGGDGWGRGDIGLKNGPKK